MLHLCMDSPSWKWTEPFPVGGGGRSGSSVKKPGSIVRSVVTQDQSWVVIIRVKHLSGLQTQVCQMFGSSVVHQSQCFIYRSLWFWGVKLKTVLPGFDLIIVKGCPCIPTLKCWLLQCVWYLIWDWLATLLCMVSLTWF